jgi:hypothetical protein
MAILSLLTAHVAIVIVVVVVVRLNIPRLEYPEDLLPALIFP